MRIGELGRLAGVDADTIRYYERIGLLPVAQRQANGYRSYGPAHLERLAFVRHCRALDMPLADIQRLLRWTEDPQQDCGDVNQLIDDRLRCVRERIEGLRQLERQLAELRSRCGAGHVRSDCGILQELVSAAHGEGCACHEDPVTTRS